jgi:NADPH2:quinone reductase
MESQMLAVVMTEHGGPDVLRLMAEFKNIHIAFENIDLPQVSADHTARLRQTRILEDAARLFDEGNLRVAVDRSYPLADAPEVHRALEAGEIIGRVVLEIP